MVSLRERAWELVSEVVDPEIPVLTIADLGVLREVVADDRGVEVVITPTYSGCPAMRVIEEEIRAALAAAGIAPVTVRTVLEPAWTTDWMSAAGRAKLLEYGIVPPPTGAVACPRCGGAGEMISAFGSTSCKGLWRCLACREPFDVFKCH